MVHGFLCAGSFFSHNIENLQQHYPIITIDLAGFGESYQYTGRDTIKSMALDVLETIAHCKLQQYYLLGHSLGGMVALQCGVLVSRATNQPPCHLLRLIAYATNCNGNLSERFETFEQSKQRLQNDYEATKSNIVATWFRQGKADPNFEGVLQCSRHVSLQSAINAIHAMQHFDITDSVPDITAQILIIGAQFDRTYTQKSIHYLREALPNADYQEIAKASHNAHFEDPKRFEEILLEFLAD